MNIYYTGGAICKFTELRLYILNLFVVPVGLEPTTS